MRPAALVFLCLLLASPAAAESIGQEMDAMLDRTPSGADVVRGLHQFDLFQQGAAATADTRGNDAVQKFADTQAAAAETRDNALDGLKSKVGIEGPLSEQPDMEESDHLAGLQGSIGQEYIRYFYQAETAELRTAISLLKRYLQKPDRAEVKAFAEKLLPMLESGEKEASNAAK